MDLIILTNGFVFDNVVLQGEIVHEDVVSFPEFKCSFHDYKTTKIIMKDVEVLDDLRVKLIRQMELQYNAVINNLSMDKFKFDCIVLSDESHNSKHDNMYLESIDYSQLDQTSDKLYVQITLKDT